MIIKLVARQNTDSKMPTAKIPTQKYRLQKYRMQKYRPDKNTDPTKIERQFTHDSNLTEGPQNPTKDSPFKRSNLTLPEII